MNAVARILGTLVLGCALFAGAARADTPTEVIGRLNDTLVDVMKNASTLGFEGRADKLRPVLLASYDLKTMARTAVGLAWEKATPEQRAEINKLFERLTVDNYASRFKSYDGEKFEIKGERSTALGKIVLTRIVRAEKQPVSIDYVMRQSGDSYRVVDVLLDSAVSEIATRRSEFTSIISRKGFAGLLASLRETTERLERDASP